MTCVRPKPVYANLPFRGIRFVGSESDGYTIDVQWFKAISDTVGFDVVYNLYYSSVREDVFTEGVKYVVLDGDAERVHLTGFKPGDVYYFAVRAALHDASLSMLSELPTAPNGLKLYPEGVLLEDITDSSLLIKVSDVDQFPPKGVIQIGVELIAYSSRDLVDGYLIVSDLSDRGIFNTEARLHMTDGYDGYSTHDNPFVLYYKGFEDGNESVMLEENKFEHPIFARTEEDGYRIVNQVGILTSDLSSSDAEQQNFPPFDFVGFTRTDPVDLLSGKCVGSYIGGEFFCADGYDGVGRRIRGLSITEINNQRQEVLLSTTGEPIVLVKRLWTGVTCSCVTTTKESPEHRCFFCFGTGIVMGYEQFFNHRRSDGRIMVRFDPSVEDLLPQDSGLEVDYKPNAWTLSTPIIRDRDFLIRFNPDGTEAYRLEILNVTRNKILLDDFGAQKMVVSRIRKTDPIYQWRVFRNTATMPTDITTTINGNEAIPPHLHTIRINEGIVSLVQLNTTTGIGSTVAPHSHPIIGGVVQSVLQHDHLIIFP